MAIQISISNAIGSRGNSGPPPVAPFNTVAPVISGTQVVGSSLSSTTGTWTGDAPISYTYQWYRGATLISGATSSTYTLVQADAGNTSNITCQVTATNGAGFATATSNTLAQIFDFDANAFITAASITDNTQKAATNTLTIDLKGYNIWTKFKAIYPIVGGTAASHKWNLKDPRDLDAAFRLNYATGVTHSANGMVSNGSSGYADTFIQPATHLLNNSCHISYYSRTNQADGSWDCGLADDANSYLTMNIRNAGGLFRPFAQDISVDTFSNSNSTGFYVANRTASNVKNGWKNGSKVVTSTAASGNRSNIKSFLLALNYGSGTGSPSFYSTRQCAFASIGDGLNDTEAANFYTAVQAYQVTLGRSIGTQTVSDADAQAFVNAANITDQVEANAINNLVIGMKADGLWTKFKAIYPIVGGVASSHAVNLKTPGTYNLTFGTGWTHNANGMTSLNTFAQTGIQPSTVLGLDNSHLSYFTTQAIDATATCMIGAYNAPNRLALYAQGLYGVNSGSWSNYTYSIGDGSQKFRIISRLSSTVQKFANNGTIQTATLNSSARPTANIELARLGGFGSDFFNGICKFASVGDGLTDTDIANFNTRVTTYQTALNRYN